MWNLFKKKKQEQPADQKEFVFIWYKKMVSGNKTHYTAPFRTKIMATTRKEAMDKLSNFALRKMTLQIIEEKDFDSSDLMKLQKHFEDLNNKFQEQLDKIFSSTNCQ